MDNTNNPIYTKRKQIRKHLHFVLFFSRSENKFQHKKPSTKEKEYKLILNQINSKSITKITTA